MNKFRITLRVSKSLNKEDRGMKAWS